MFDEINKNEEKVLSVIENGMDFYGDGFSDVTFDEIVWESKMELEIVRGVVGSLVKKGLVTFQEVEDDEDVYYSTRWMENNL